jgi:hypothetical protein
VEASDIYHRIEELNNKVYGNADHCWIVEDLIDELNEAMMYVKDGDEVEMFTLNISCVMFLCMQLLVQCKTDPMLAVEDRIRTVNMLIKSAKELSEKMNNAANLKP